MPLRAPSRPSTPRPSPVSSPLPTLRTCAPWPPPWRTCARSSRSASTQPSRLRRRSSSSPRRSGATTDLEVEEPPARETAAAAPETSPAPQQVSASSSLVKRPALNLASVRASQPRVLPEPPAPGTQLTAAVDVPGYTPGAPLDFGQVVTGIISRANALKTAGGGTGQVISYRHPFQQELIVTDSSSAPEGTTVAIAAQNQGGFRRVTLWLLVAGVPRRRRCTTSPAWPARTCCGMPRRSSSRAAACATTSRCPWMSGPSRGCTPKLTTSPVPRNPVSRSPARTRWRSAVTLSVSAWRQAVLPVEADLLRRPAGQHRAGLQCFQPGLRHE